MLLKPRFGSRTWSGIWPPSKPKMETPERLVWPFWPRPAVLPRPEPMPRPTRNRALRAPCLLRGAPRPPALHSLPPSARRGAAPRAEAAADANPGLTGALIVAEIVKFHCLALAFAFVAHDQRISR